MKASLRRIALLSLLMVFALAACTQGQGTGSESENAEAKVGAAVETEVKTVSLDERVQAWAQFAGVSDAGKIAAVRASLQGFAYDPQQFNPEVANVLLQADPNFVALAKPAAKTNLAVYKTFSLLFIKVPTTEEEKQEAEEQGIDSGELEALVAKAKQRLETVTTAIAAFRFAQSYFGNAMSYFYDLDFRFNRSDLPAVKNAFGDTVPSGHVDAALAYRYVAAVTFTIGADTQRVYTFFDLSYQASPTQEDEEAGENPGESAMGRFLVKDAADNPFVLSLDKAMMGETRLIRRQLQEFHQQ